jgi:hypothetical protein
MLMRRICSVPGTTGRLIIQRAPLLQSIQRSSATWSGTEFRLVNRQVDTQSLDVIDPFQQW